MDGKWVQRPVANDNHSDVQGNLYVLLRAAAGPLNAKARFEWSITQPNSPNPSEPDYLTPDLLVVMLPFERSPLGHLVPPGFLAVEIKSPKQGGLFAKAQLYHSWGIAHCWIIDPDSHECFEFHGGNQFTIERDELHAGPLVIRPADIFAGIEP